MKKNIKKYRAFCIVLFFISGLCSCVSTSTDSTAAPSDKKFYAYLTNNARFQLLPTDAIEKPINMAQIISVSYGSQSFYFNAWVKADSQLVEIRALESGNSAEVLSYSKNNIKLSYPGMIIPDSIKPEFLIADFQLCFYDTAALEEALKKCSLVLQIDGSTRRVLNGKNTVIEIEKYPKIIRLTNNYRGYSYTMEGNFP